MPVEHRGFEHLEGFCARARAAVLDEIERLVGAHAGAERDLYRLMLDYPLRPAKALRPSLCLAACRALGGPAEAVLRSAAVIELLHNAFLIHDDVEDESLYRRGERTLQRAQGLPVAVNVGDGMFALALRPLLDNTAVVGLGPALEILDEIAEMVRVTVEGQATELAWIRDNTFRFPDYRAAYEDMVARKTARYSFVTPVEVGAIAAAAPAGVRERLRGWAARIGVAFQIADDLLNLSDEALGSPPVGSPPKDGGAGGPRSVGGAEGPVMAYGKERAGDLWEGKRTLILLHALHAEGDTADGRRALAALARPRPQPARARLSHPSDPSRRSDDEVLEEVREAVEALHREGRLDGEARRTLLAVSARARPRDVKTDEDVALLRELIERHGALRWTREVALEHVEEARRAFARLRDALAAGEARDFLETLAPYVVERLH
jgi:geranylgeranyl diphosphate synthase type II